MLPEPEYYSIERLAKYWTEKYNKEVTIQDILDYGLSGQIEVRWYSNNISLLPLTVDNGVKFYTDCYDIHFLALKPNDLATVFTDYNGDIEYQFLFINKDNYPQVNFNQTNSVRALIKEIKIPLKNIEKLENSNE